MSVSTRVAAVLTLSVLAAGARADELYLTSGGRLSGNIVSRSATAVEIEVSAGRVTVPHRLIARIVEGESVLSRYQARARALAPNDAHGWLDLAEWARQADLSGQARDAYERVLAIEPDNPVARAALDHQRVGEQWLTRDAAMAARGFVRFEGQWVQPVHRDTVLAEREAAVRERAETERARLAIAEAEARAREAEARARAAEAEAAAAEAAAERERDTFVVSNGFWGGPIVGPFVVGGGPHCAKRPLHPTTAFGATTFGFTAAPIIPTTTFGFSISTRSTGAAPHVGAIPPRRSEAQERRSSRVRGTVAARENAVRRLDH